MDDKTRLTPKRERFAQLLVPGNLSQAEAYRIAFPGTKMTRKQMYEEACKLVQDPKIVQRLAELRRPAIEESQVELTRVLRELARISFFDPRRLLDEDGSPKPLSELDDDTAAAIAGMKVRTIKGKGGDTSVVTEYKLPDKGANLDRLMKYLGAYERDNNQKGDALAQLLQAIAGGNGSTINPVAVPPVRDKE